MTASERWTFGAEHELVDWDTRQPMPAGWGRDRNDVSMVNSDGIAVDPRGELWPLGGEALSPPTDSIEGQANALAEFLALHPDATVNYRSNLHVHVRVPGLKDDLTALKRLAQFNHDWLGMLLDVIEPIPFVGGRHGDAAERGAHKRYLRRRRSHHTVLPESRVRRQLRANTVQEFFEAEVPRNRATGKPMWHAQPRAAVNVRQLLQTDTVEFRHFPGTTNPEELFTAVEWCEGYMLCALGKLLPTDPRSTPASLWHALQDRPWPQFRPYNHGLEITYQQTVRGSAPLHVLRANIERLTGVTTTS